MTSRLNERVAIITGAGDGIGEGVARRFAAEGAKVLVADIDEESAARVAADLRRDFAAQCVALRVDVTEREQVIGMVATAVAALGAADILVNNAWGGGELGRIEDKSDELMEHGLKVAYFGPLWAMQASFPHMRRSGWGRIINLCSLNGVNAHIGTADYNGAKEGLRALTRTAAREWAPYGIVVNALCPGAKTAAFRAVVAAHPEIETLADNANPMGYLGDAEADIAPVALFLASDDARYLTGNTLFVDGGSHINGVSWAPELPDSAIP